MTLENISMTQQHSQNVSKIILDLSWWEIFKKRTSWYLKILLRDKMSPRRYETGVPLLRVFLAAYCFWRRRKLVFQCSCVCLLRIRVCFTWCPFDVLKNNHIRSGATHYSSKRSQNRRKKVPFVDTFARRMVCAGCGSIFAVDRGSSPINPIDRTTWASERVSNQQLASSSTRRSQPSCRWTDGKPTGSVHCNQHNVST